MLVLEVFLCHLVIQVMLRPIYYEKNQLSQCREAQRLTLKIGRLIQDIIPMVGILGEPYQLYGKLIPYHSHSDDPKSLT